MARLWCEVDTPSLCLLAQCPSFSWAPDHPARALGDICIWRAHLQHRISKPESATAPSTLPTLFLPPTPSASSVSVLISGTIDHLVIWFHSFLSSAICVPIAVNGKDVSGSRFRPPPPHPLPPSPALVCPHCSPCSPLDQSSWNNLTLLVSLPPAHPLHCCRQDLSTAHLLWELCGGTPWQHKKSKLGRATLSDPAYHPVPFLLVPLNESQSSRGILLSLPCAAFV